MGSGLGQPGGQLGALAGLDLPGRVDQRHAHRLQGLSLAADDERDLALLAEDPQRRRAARTGWP